MNDSENEGVGIGICKGLVSGEEVDYEVSEHIGFIMYRLDLFDTFGQLLARDMTREERASRRSTSYQQRFFEFSPAESDYGYTTIYPNECQQMAGAIRKEIKENSNEEVIPWNKKFLLKKEEQAALEGIAQFLDGAANDERCKYVEFYPC